jgi:hypothetical protein
VVGDLPSIISKGLGSVPAAHTNTLTHVIFLITKVPYGHRNMRGKCRRTVV